MTTAIVLLLLPTEEGVAIGARLAPPMAITLLIAVLVLVRHRSNIARLVSGSETTVGKSSDTPLTQVPTQAAHPRHQVHQQGPEKA